MKIKYKLLVYLSFVLLHGCTGSSPMSLKQNTSRVYSYCLNETPRDLFKKVGAEMSACYSSDSNGDAFSVPAGGNLIPIFIDSSSWIEAENKDGIYSLSFAIKNAATTMYGLTIDFHTTQACRSDVKVYVINSFWEKHHENLKVWLLNENKTPSCWKDNKS